MKQFSDMTYTEFAEVLASKEPVPGGGGASALVGALGVALCSMVGNLTVGRKKYAAVEADVYSILDKAKVIQARLIELIEEDAKVFEPLAAAYAIPKDDPMRGEIMEKILANACAAPLEMMQCCCEAIDLLAEMLEKGSVTLVSDVGVGALLCGAALQGASLNIYINTKSMMERANAEEINRKADAMLHEHARLAGYVYEQVAQRLR
jgi:formiminotetrahydrofolate cyclodeaminase